MVSILRIDLRTLLDIRRIILGSALERSLW